MHNTIVMYVHREHGTGLGSDQWADKVVAVAPSGSILETEWMDKYPGGENEPPYRWRVSWNPRTEEWALTPRQGYFDGAFLLWAPGGAGWV